MRTIARIGNIVVGVDGGNVVIGWANKTGWVEPDRIETVTNVERLTRELHRAKVNADRVYSANSEHKTPLQPPEPDAAIVQQRGDSHWYVVKSPYSGRRVSYQSLERALSKASEVLARERY